MPFLLQRDMKISPDIRDRVLAYYEYLVNHEFLLTLYPLPKLLVNYFFFICGLQKLLAVISYVEFF